MFGTDLDIVGGERTEEEVEVGRYVRGAWAAFAKDPEGGLEECVFYPFPIPHHYLRPSIY